MTTNPTPARSARFLRNQALLAGPRVHKALRYCAGCNLPIVGYTSAVCEGKVVGLLDQPTQAN